MTKISTNAGTGRKFPPPFPCRLGGRWSLSCFKIGTPYFVYERRTICMEYQWLGFPDSVCPDPQLAGFFFSTSVQANISGIDGCSGFGGRICTGGDQPKEIETGILYRTYDIPVYFLSKRACRIALPSWTSSSLYTRRL